MDENKSKALQAALSQIEKQFGKNTVMRLGDNTVQAVEAVSTGSFNFRHRIGDWWFTKRPYYRNLWS